MELAWATDIHLDHCSKGGFPKFADSIKEKSPEGLILTGDISVGYRLFSHLETLAQKIGPYTDIYFVLGNHDFWGKSIEKITEEATRLSNKRDQFNYLTHSMPVMLDDGVFLTGVDGWYDGKAGNFERSTVQLADGMMIAEMRLPRNLMGDKMRELGETYANMLGVKLGWCISLGAEKIIIATHVPPWNEAAWHEGKPSDEYFAPFFVCQSVGETIEGFADANPGTEFVVLCGHSHGEGEYRPKENVVCYTGGAKYGSPALQEWSLRV